MNEKITVIIPVYNVEKYLARCVDSVINQTYKNLEIILVDDGSPDNCPKICDEYAEKDSRIKVIHKENGWISSARNAGMDIMTGEYVTFVDSDDYIKENMIEHMLGIMKKHDAEVVQVGYSSDEDEFCKPNEAYSEEIIVGRENIKTFIRDKKIKVVVWGKLYKRNIIKDLRFLEGLKYAEDNEFGYRLYKNVKKTVSTNEKMYFYCLENTTSITHTASNGYLPWETWCELYSQAVEREKNCRWLRNLFYSHLIRSIASYYMEAAKRGDFELCSRLREEVAKKGGINILRMDFRCKIKYLVLRNCKDARTYLRLYAYFMKIRKMFGR